MGPFHGGPARGAGAPLSRRLLLCGAVGCWKGTAEGPQSSRSAAALTGISRCVLLAGGAGGARGGGVVGESEGTRWCFVVLLQKLRLGEGAVPCAGGVPRRLWWDALRWGPIACSPRGWGWRGRGKSLPFLYRNSRNKLKGEKSVRCVFHGRWRRRWKVHYPCANKPQEEMNHSDISGMHRK